MVTRGKFVHYNGVRVVFVLSCDTMVSFDYNCGTYIFVSLVAIIVVSFAVRGLHNAKLARFT